MKKRVQFLRPGYWWATQRVNGKTPPCLWGKYRRDAQPDQDEFVVRVYVCEAKDHAQGLR